MFRGAVRLRGMNGIRVKTGHIEHYQYGLTPNTVFFIIFLPGLYRSRCKSIALALFWCEPEMVKNTSSLPFRRWNLDHPNA